MADLQSVPTHQQFQVIRQLGRFRYLRAFDKNGHYSNAALECGCDFQTYEIFRIVQATLAPMIGRGEPTMTNHCDENITGAYDVFYGLNEVSSGLNVVDVHKNLSAGKMALQA